jgi:mRNA interferase RelE/StbE
VTWRLFLDKKRAQNFYDHLPEKSRAIVRDHLLRLAEDPCPRSGADKEQLTIRGDNRYFCLHIDRSLTAFHTIHEEERTVYILEILTIEQAHKKYGRLGSRR